MFHIAEKYSREAGVRNFERQIERLSRKIAYKKALNQSYPKEEYFRRVMEIKEQMKAEGTYGRWWWETPYPELEPSPAYMALQYY